MRWWLPLLIATLREGHHLIFIYKNTYCLSIVFLHPLNVACVFYHKHNFVLTLSLIFKQNTLITYKPRTPYLTTGPETLIFKFSAKTVSRNRPILFKSSSEKSLATAKPTSFWRIRSRSFFAWLVRIIYFLDLPYSWREYSFHAKELELIKFINYCLFLLKISFDLVLDFLSWIIYHVHQPHSRITLVFLLKDKTCLLQ